MELSIRAFRASKRRVLASVLLLAGAASVAEAKTERPLSDPEIVQYVLDANLYEQQASDVAKGKASTPAVLQLAERLSADQGAVDQEFRSLQLSPKEGDRLDARGLRRLAWLDRLEGDQFEESYVDYDFSLHKSLLAALDRLLLPNAKDSQLKARLQELRSEEAADLKKVEHVKEMTDWRRMMRIMGTSA